MVTAEPGRPRQVQRRLTRGEVAERGREYKAGIDMKALAARGIHRTPVAAHLRLGGSVALSRTR